MFNPASSFSLPRAFEDGAPLLTAEALQSAILNNAHIFSIATDAKGVIQIFNVGAQRMLGYAADEVIHRLSLVDISDPQELVTYAASLSQARGTFIPPDFEALIHKTSQGDEGLNELTCICKDGRRLSAKVSITTLRDATGDTTGYLLIGAENTASKQVYAVQEESQNRLKKITSRVPGMVYQSRMRPDGSFCIPYVSDAIRDIYRLTPGDVQEDASPLLSIIHPDDFANFIESIEQSAKNLAVWQQEYRVKFDDGVVRWVFGTAMPERESDGATLWHGFSTDITERIKSQEKLRISDLALKAISQGVLIADVDGCILSANAAFFSITGYSEPEVLGRRCSFVQGPLTDSSTVKLIQQARINETEFNGDILNYRKDGSTFWNELSISPVFDANGQLIHYIGITRDITTRKRAEDTLARQRQVLKQTVALRTTELTTALMASKITAAGLQLEFSEHKRTAQLLQRSQMVTAQATRLAELGAWSIELNDLENFDLNPVIWSEEMYRLMDCTRQDVPTPKPDSFCSRLHPQDCQRVMDRAFQAMTEKRAWQDEYRLIWQDGSERLMSQLGDFAYDAAGRPIWMHGAVKDITVQRQLEDELRASEARLSMALEGAGAACYEWNRATGVDIWSAEIREILGLSTSSAPACYQTWCNAVHPDDLGRIQQTIELAVDRELKYEVEWRVNLPPSRPTRWLMERAVPVPNPDGRVFRYRGIVIDISKRKATEQALNHYRFHLEERVAERTADILRSKAEQRRLNRALSLLSESRNVITHALDKLTLLNEICRLVVETGGYLMAWVGLAVQDVGKTVRPMASFGDTTHYLDHIEVSWHPEHASGQGGIGKALQTGQTQVHQDCGSNPLLAPWHEAAQARGFQSTASIPLVIEGKNWGVLALYAKEPNGFGSQEVDLLEDLADDIGFGLQALSDHRQLELHQKHLEELVTQRTTEIDQLNVELRDKARDAESANRAKSAFLATMSHELRTPLSAVIGLSGLLAESPLSRRQRDMTDKIQLSAKTLQALIVDILDFSKIEAGELRLAQAPYSLTAILRNTATLLGVALAKKPIEALFDVSPDVPDTLWGDAQHLQQILLNLTSNAVKFTDAGAIVVTVRCLSPNANQDSQQVDLRFTVRDTGLGIASEQLESIFNSFVQADTSISRMYGGSGLGLTISARLAALMGGQVTVESIVGQGSAFHLDVPLTLGPPLPQDLPAVIPPLLNVLIVDDHPLARELLSQTCHTFGWQTTAVGSGAAALAELQRNATESNDFDLMLLDWRMPEQDGLQMLRQAYATPGIGLPLVVLMASITELEHAVAASDDLFLDGIATKPLLPSTLLEAITRVYSGDKSSLLPLKEKNDFRLAGMRLLVAEDNELNQEVVMEILNRAGAEVVLVANGAAAVAAVRSPDAHFDAVLMDIQMPVMDGYTATHIIREDLGRLDLPIIAVTAFARPEDRKNSRLAGMRGHIVKPINVEDLLDLLVMDRRGETARPPLPLVELTKGLDIAAAIKNFGGNDKKYTDILRKFLLKHGGDVAEARCLLNADTPQSAITLLHDLSGIASFLQARRLADLATSAEEALTDNHLDLLAPLLDELQTEMLTIQSSIQQFEMLAAAE